MRQQIPFAEMEKQSESSCQAVFKDLLNAMAVDAVADSLGICRQGEMRFVISHSTAKSLAETAEMKSYAQASPFMRHELEHGFPTAVYGYAFVIDDRIDDGWIELQVGR